MARMMLFLLTLSLLAAPSVVDAQTLLYVPVSTPVMHDFVAVPAPVHVVQRPGIISRPGAVLQPGPVPTPLVSVPSAVAAPPMFAPVSTYRVEPVPVYAYRPLVSAPAVVPFAPRYVPGTRPVVVRTKTYVRGQPLRNLLRAITP